MKQLTMFKFASPKTLLFSIFLLPFLIFGNYSYAVQEYSEEETSIEREEKDPNQPLESQIEIIEHELNEPIRGFLGEDAKIRIGGDIIYGTGNGANRVYAPQVSLGLQGRITENNFFLVDWNIANMWRGNFEQSMMDITLRNESIKNNKIYIGRMRPQVGIDGTVSSYHIPMIERAQISRTFAGVRDYGIKINGDYKYAKYSFGLFNGFRNELRHNPGSPDFSGMIVLIPMNSEKFGEFSIGGGYSTGKRYYSYNVLSSYAKYSYKKLDIEAEYMHADGYNGEVNSPDKAQGFYIMPTYHLNDNIEILARYDVFDPNVNIGDNNSKEYTIGVNYYLANRRIRLATNYVYADTPNGNSNRIMFMTQFRP